MSQVIATVEELKAVSNELASVMSSLRFWTKYWQIHYGSQAKNKKEYWENKADQLLTRLGITEHENQKAILFNHHKEK